MVVLVLSLWLGAAAQERPTDSVNVYQRVNALQREGEHEQALTLLKNELANHPADNKLRYALGVVFAQVGRMDDATMTLKELRARGADQFGMRLETLLERVRQQEVAHRELVERLRSLDVDGAMRRLEHLPLDESTRELVRAHIDLYGARFVSAASRALTLERQQRLSREAVQQFLGTSREASQQFQQQALRLKWYLESPLGLSACTPDLARRAALTAEFALPEYVQLASSAFANYPLNPWLMDLAFHATLISAPYEDVKRFGELVLNGRGVLKIPFFSRSSRFWFVIDRRQNRVYAEPNMPRGNPLGSDALADDAPFNVAFTDVRELRQRAQTDIATGSLKADTHAVQIRPANGVAPYYAFMPLLQCFYGEEVQRTVTYNLGRFVAESLGSAPKTVLVDPTGRTRDWLGLVSGALAIATAGAETAASFTQGVQAGRADQAAFQSSVSRAQALVAGGLAADPQRTSAVSEAQSQSRSVFYAATAEHLSSARLRVTSERAYEEIADLARPGH